MPELIPPAASPHQILRDILDGRQVSRPLFAPITFGIASRIENLSLHSFLTNPTKISNALRQIYPPLRTDAVTCYHDRFLVAESLGAIIELNTQYESSTLRWPSAAGPGDLPQDLPAPEDVIKRGRLPAALDVIRRLKAMLRDTSLLMVSLTGPFTLAMQVLGLDDSSERSPQNQTSAAVEIAAATIAQIAKVFAEAGANLILLREEVAPPSGSQASDQWISTLSPIANILRFYQTVPVLQIVGASNSGITTLAGRSGCVPCLPLHAIQNALPEVRASLNASNLGISLPVEMFQTEVMNREAANFKALLGELNPPILTTVNDLPPTTDPKCVAAVAALTRNP